MWWLYLLCLFPLGLTAQFSEAATEWGMTGSQWARGVSVCDYDADGWPDVYLSVLNGPNRLYRNRAGSGFEEVASGAPLAVAGNSMVSLWADFDNDGLPEVLVGNKDTPSRLYRQSDQQFIDITAGSGIALTAKVQAGSVLDVDQDGLLDIYLACLNGPNRLYRNLGQLRFEEVSTVIANPGCSAVDVAGLAMGTLAFDYDLDGDQDLYLVHDGKQPNVLLRNEGGCFTDVSVASGTGVVGDGMGVDAADYDHDGDFDLYITNLYENFLLENLGNGTFREVGFDASVNDLGMGWGTAWLDYDSDGHPDLYVANETGFTVGGRQYNNLLYYNNGMGAFIPAAPPSAAINSDRSSYGAATADFDGDGRPDLVLANNAQPTELFINQTPSGSYLQLDLVGTSGNREAIGSRVQLYTAQRRQTAEVRAGGSFASQHGRTLHFGLGAVDRIDSVVVYWPQGARTTYTNLVINRRYQIVEGEAPTETNLAVLTTPTNRPEVLPLGVYPNPSQGQVYFGRPVEGLRLYDALGRQLIRIDQATDRLKLPPQLPPGAYRLTGWIAGQHHATTLLVDRRL